MEGYQLRPAEAADCPRIAAIYNGYLGTHTFDLQAKPVAYFTHLLASLSEREGCWVLETRQRLAGWGILRAYSPREGYRFTGETSVYLDPNARGQGWGPLIKGWLIRAAKDRQYHHLVAKIIADNTASIRYNQRLGYEMVGIQREVGKVNGKWVDVAIMQLIL